MRKSFWKVDRLDERSIANAEIFYTNGIARRNFFFIRQMAEVRPLIYVYTPNLLRTKFTFLPDKWSHSPVRSFDCLISHWIRDWDLKICRRASIELFETAEKVFLLWINLYRLKKPKPNELKFVFNAWLSLRWLTRMTSMIFKIHDSFIKKKYVQKYLLL